MKPALACSQLPLASFTKLLFEAVKEKKKKKKKLHVMCVMH